MDQKGKIEQNIKIEYALSALMFFSPFLKNLLKKNNKLTSEDKKFIFGFIKLGYINIILLILAAINEIIFLKTGNNSFQIIAITILTILIIIIGIGCFLAISGKDINKNGTTESDKENLIKFIPIYNIYLRYKTHDFENADSISKEGIFYRSIFSIIILLSPNKYTCIILSTFIIFRIICAINGIKFGKGWDETINYLFKKNPEEIRGIIVGIISYIFKKGTLSENIESHKKDFEYLFKLNNRQVIAEYILLIITIIYLGYLGIINKNIYLLLGVILIIARYLIMIINWEHLPHLPILRGFTNIFLKGKKETEGKNL